MASDAPIFERLVGLETEYAIRFRPHEPEVERPADHVLFDRLIAELRRRVPVLEAGIEQKEGVFTGNGGAVWFERVRYSGGTGLVEGATPECRGPHQAQLYQRAQDRLLADALRAAAPDGECVLLKNDRDSRGRAYGAQENYEATLAHGWAARVWQAGLWLLLPGVLLAWIGVLVIFLLYVVYLALAGVVYLLAMPILGPQSRALFGMLFGRDLADRRAKAIPLPEWGELVMGVALRVFIAPLALPLLVLLHAVAFRKTRRRLLPFLVTRPVFCGAGWLDQDGAFQIADKAPAANCLIGFGGLFFDRPVFSFGHVLKSLSMKPWLPVAGFARVLGRRQRLQICLGDSNMSEEAEFLRVGTTLLVLDAIEAGFLEDVPRVRRPLKVLRACCRDADLSAPLEFAGGRAMTALQVQRTYLAGCRRFVEQHPDPPPEAFDVLQRWQDVLDMLELNPREALGRVDWVTKRYMLDEAEDAPADARKKIDLRYHELSPEGYFERLRETGIGASTISRDDLDWAARHAPPNTRAAVRGRYVTQAATLPNQVRVDWESVWIREGRQTRRIPLETL